VHVAEPLFQPHDNLAIRGKAKMPRLDDSGVHRADRNLMQPLPSHWLELVIGRIA
jgi:hypothetical protein